MQSWIVAAIQPGLESVSGDLLFSSAIETKRVAPCLESHMLNRHVLLTVSAGVAAVVHMRVKLNQ